jgi:hypothetical protein
MIDLQQKILEQCFRIDNMLYLQIVKQFYITNSKDIFFKNNIVKKNKNQVHYYKAMCLAAISTACLCA